MAMARSSFKGMCCEVGTYLYTQGKTGASLMFQTWRRGLICLLVLASFPFLAPMIIVTMVVGGVFLVPLLCGVAACRALARPGSLLNIIKKIRFPKSVLRSGSAELVMEDLDVHDGGNRDHGASRGMFSPDCKDVADSSNVGIAAEGEDSASCVPSEKKLAVDEEIMKDKVVVLHGRNGRAQEEENRPSESLLSQELVEAKSPSQQYGEHCADDSDPEAGNQYLEIKETDAFHFDVHERERGEDQSMTVEPSDKDPIEDEFSILDITASGIQLELNLPADKEESSQVQVVDTQQEQLEEPEQLKENLPECAPEERLPDDSTAPYMRRECQKVRKKM
ncbi:hypothetical protein KC19_3G235100 [Ceratodon purpureus]|uniref:Uncharacterized protein n=1 Tax=Ceratodon purpureus TaxID=3225 RepID=A0A8T0IP61_CERPU|nr:hypothetical protein KC19_3G235100 [Ceratodon purpureus]